MAAPEGTATGSARQRSDDLFAGDELDALTVIFKELEQTARPTALAA